MMTHSIAKTNTLAGDNQTSYLVKKQRFFLQPQSGTKHDQVVRIKESSDARDFRFLTQNRLLIEQEFDQLFAVLETNKKRGEDGPEQDEFWLYCYYCAILLHSFYSGYRKPELVEKYSNLLTKLEARCRDGKFPQQAIIQQSLRQKLVDDLAEVASTPNHLGKIRNGLTYTHIYRIHYVFCRLTVKYSLLMARELQWLDKFDKVTGGHTDVDRMVAMINAPAAVFNGLSVGVPAARLLIDLGKFFKHTFIPTEAEKCLTMSERAYHEFIKRRCDIANDVVWTTVNGLSNYAYYFKLSGLVAAWLTAGFLIFDVSLLTYRLHLAEQDFELKRAQYEGERRLWTKNLSTTADQQEISRIKRHISMLDEQLKQLELSRLTTRYTYLFNVAAAAILMGGFSASLLLATPVAVAVCCLICTVAVAMYLSGDAYSKYMQKSLVLAQCEREEKFEMLKGLQVMQQSPSMVIALREAKEARNDFILTMLKNTMMPMLVVATFAVCWQAALVLAAVYLSYEVFGGYFKKPDTRPLPLLISTSETKAIGIIDEEQEAHPSMSA